MFYPGLILAKKGSLAKIWLAAHWDKKLTKHQVVETDIEKTVEDILRPKVRLALRTSGHLLLGIVRIYYRKTNYLLKDCNEALEKLRIAFRPLAIIDMPDDHREASKKAITLQENFHDFEIALPDLSDLNVDLDNTLNQSRADEISLKDDVSVHFGLSHIDEFALLNDFNNIEMLRANSFGARSINRTSMPDSFSTSRMSGNAAVDVEIPLVDDFGAPFNNTGNPELFNLNDELDLFQADRMDVDGINSEPNIRNLLDANDGDDIPNAGKVLSPPRLPRPSVRISNFNLTETVLVLDRTFALDPLDATSMHENAKQRVKRKRKIIVDEVKTISNEEMAVGLNDRCNTLATMDLAPPTKKMMYWKDSGSVEKMLIYPGNLTLSNDLLKMYTANLTHRPDNEVVEDMGLTLDDLEVGRAAELTAINEPPVRPLSPIAEEISDNATQSAKQNSELQLLGTDVHMSDIGDVIPQPEPSPARFSRPVSPLVAEPPMPDPFVLDEASMIRSPFRQIQLEGVSSTPSQPRRSQNEALNEIENNTHISAESSFSVSQYSAGGILDVIRHKIQKTDNGEITFTTLSGKRDTRKTAANKFYMLLVLKKHAAVEVYQNEPYGEITIKAGANLKTAVL